MTSKYVTLKYSENLASKLMAFENLNAHFL